MIVGVGVDIVDIARFEQKLEQTPALRERLFTPTEQGRKTQSLAGIFAAKEALIKALGGSKDLSWQDMSIVKNDAGAPRFELNGSLQTVLDQHAISSVHVSISHEQETAVAFVVAEGSDSSGGPQ